MDSRHGSDGGIQAEFAGAGQGDRIVAQAEVMRPGRTLTIVRSDVSAIDGDKETVCATSVVTIIRWRASRTGRRDDIHGATWIIE